MSDRLDAYREICANIRESDNISFKLLSLVPTIATFLSALLAFVGFSDETGDETWIFYVAVILFSLCGLVLVLGIYKWEMRNVQKCNSLIASAADLEGADLGFQYSRWREQAPAGGWGKTASERLIYRTAMALWLVPIIVAGLSLCASVA